MNLTSEKATATTIELVKAVIQANPIQNIGDEKKAQWQIASEHAKYVLKLYEDIYQGLIQAPDMED
jgi:hypothetical protein